MIMQLLSSIGRSCKTVLEIWIYGDADLGEVADRRNGNRHASPANHNISARLPFTV
jgi:hypothetical protein